MVPKRKCSLCGGLKAIRFGRLVCGQCEREIRKLGIQIRSLERDKRMCHTLGIDPNDEAARWLKEHEEENG